MELISTQIERKILQSRLRRCCSRDEPLHKRFRSALAPCGAAAWDVLVPEMHVEIMRLLVAAAEQSAAGAEDLRRFLCTSHRMLSLFRSCFPQARPRITKHGSLDRLAAVIVYDRVPLLLETLCENGFDEFSGIPPKSVAALAVHMGRHNAARVWKHCYSLASAQPAQREALVYGATAGMLCSPRGWTATAEIRALLPPQVSMPYLQSLPFNTLHIDRGVWLRSSYYRGDSAFWIMEKLKGVYLFYAQQRPVGAGEQLDQLQWLHARQITLAEDIYANIALSDVRVAEHLLAHGPRLHSPQVLEWIYEGALRRGGLRHDVFDRMTAHLVERFPTSDVVLAAAGYLVQALTPAEFTPGFAQFLRVHVVERYGGRFSLFRLWGEALAAHRDASYRAVLVNHLVWPSLKLGVEPDVAWACFLEGCTAATAD